MDTATVSCAGTRACSATGAPKMPSRCGRQGEQSLWFGESSYKLLLDLPADFSQLRDRFAEVAVRLHPGQSVLPCDLPIQHPVLAQGIETRPDAAALRPERCVISATARTRCIRKRLPFCREPLAPPCRISAIHPTMSRNPGSTPVRRSHAGTCADSPERCARAPRSAGAVQWLAPTDQYNQ